MEVAEKIKKKKLVVPKLRFKEFKLEWNVSNLGELGNFLGGGTPNTKTFKYWNGNIPWISSSDLFEDDIHKINIHRFINDEAIAESATKIIPKKSVLLISRVGVGKVAVNKEDICTSQDFCNFIPKEVHPYFIGYLLIARKNLLVNFSQGTSIKGFTTADAKSLKIPHPLLPEQQKIASFLSAVDEKIQQLTRKKELLEQYKRGVMQQIFSRKLRFKDEKGKDFPEWEENRLGEVSSSYSGGTPTSTKKEYYFGKIPFIRSGEISKDNTELFISEEGLKNSSAKMVDVGDLLYALYGATAGEVAISKIKGAINQAILCIKSELNSEYLFCYLKMNKEHILNKYLQGGQGNLSAQIIKELIVPVPSTKEQQKIANYLSAIGKRIETINNQITQTKTFKKGLLRQMFC